MTFNIERKFLSSQYYASHRKVIEFFALFVSFKFIVCIINEIAYLIFVMLRVITESETTFNMHSVESHSRPKVKPSCSF